MRDLSTGALHAEHRGAGTRIVLVHGFTQTGRSWGPVAADLARDHELVAVDAPGHGVSARVFADLPGGGELLATFGPATFVGYSMGGRFCLHAALAHPEQVTRLVLLGATAGIDGPGERAARVRSDDALAADLERDGVDAFLDRWLALPLFRGLAPGAADRDDRRRNTVAGLASSLRLAGSGTQVPAWDRLHTLTMPMLLLAGDRDAKFAALAHRMAAAIGANATCALVPDAGHAAHRENPDGFVAILRAWLSA
jgi:2-succinyl-6-hydroxy-2,4-cyclohexadiene-1-carboxylate synthase